MKSHIHKQSDLEQLPVGFTNICFVWGSNPQHAAQQSISQSLRQLYNIMKKISCHDVTLYWDRPITDRTIVANKPDIVVTLQHAAQY